MNTPFLSALRPLHLAPVLPVLLWASSMACGRASPSIGTAISPSIGRGIPRSLEYRSTTSGLPSDLILDIAIDPADRVWIATMAGLTVFDGTSWTPSTQLSPLAASSATFAIGFDRKGRAWVGGRNGIAVFDCLTVTQCDYQQWTITGSPVLAIAFDNQDRTWVGTNEGLAVLEGNTWVSVQLPKLSAGPYGTPEYKPARVTALALDTSGMLWVGLDFPYGGLTVINPITLTTTSPSELPLYHVNVYSIRIDQLGRPLIGTPKGLYVLTTKPSPSKDLVANLIGDLNVLAIAFDREGRIWVTTRYGGISIYDGSAWTTLIPGPSPAESSEAVWYDYFPLAFDTQGGAWAGAAEFPSYGLPYGTGLVSFPVYPFSP